MSIINSATEFLQALEQIGSSNDQSIYVAQEQFLASKDLIVGRFGGNAAVLEQVVADLMDATKTPLIRDQRVGIKLAINQKVNKSGLRALLLSVDQSRTLSDLIAAHAHQVFSHEELLNLFDDETLAIMSEHTRIRVEKTIRTECKPIIMDLVKRIIGKVNPSEVVVLLSHLPSSSSSDEILQILNQLQLDNISGSVMVRRHPQVVAQFIRQQLDKTIKGAVPQVSLWNLLVSTLGELSAVFFALSKVAPTAAFSIVDDYFIQYAIKENIPIDAVQSYLVLKVKNFPETFKSSCVNEKSKITLNVNDLLKKFSIEDVAGIYLKKMQVLNYATSSESMTFLRSFDTYSYRGAKKIQVLTSKLVNKVGDVEKVSEWIFQNVQPSSEIPNFLKFFPLSVVNSVASKLYEIRKLKDFATPDQETKYWRYMNKVEDEASFKKFKGLCSHSQPGVRTNVLLDLLFCSVLHERRVKETLEFIDSRLKNDIESIQAVVGSLTNDTLLSVKLFTAVYKSEELRDAFHTVLENTAKKADASWYYINLFTCVFRFYKEDATILKYLIERNSKFSKFVNLEFITNTYGLSLKPEVHKIVTQATLPTLKSRVESSGDLSLFRSLLNLGDYKKQPEYIEEIFQKVFGEWLPTIVSKVRSFSGIVDIANLVFKGLDKKTAIEKMKQLLSKEAGFFLCENVQRLLLSRSSPLDREFVLQFIKEKTLTGTDLQALSTSGFTHNGQLVATISPQLLSALRIDEYSSSELTRRLIATYTNLLFRSGRCSPVTLGYSYNSASSLCKIMIKALSHIAIESGEMQGLIEFLETKFLPKDSQASAAGDENVAVAVVPATGEEEPATEEEEEAPETTEEEEQDQVKMDVEDNATRCLASLVRIYSQKPTDHFQYVLDNINSENVLYYFSAIGRISTFYNDVQFVDLYCKFLKKQFTEALGASKLPANMTISVQKMLIVRLKAYVQHLNPEIPAKIVDTVIEIWNLKPQKDVQVAILTTVLSALKHDGTGQLFSKAKTLLEQAVSHEYEDIVIAVASFSIAKSVSTMRDIFYLRLKTLEHPVSKIQTSAWSVVSYSASAPTFIKRVASESFNPVALLRKYIVDAVLTFNPQQQHSIANVAIDVLLKEIIETPDEAASTLLDAILTPLLTEEKFKVLDTETFNADIAWDRPVKARLTFIVNSLSTKVASSYQLIPEHKKEAIQHKIVNPLIEIVKKNVQNRIPFACIVSSIRTNWTSADSVIQNSIKNVADLVSDVEEPLKSFTLAKIVSNSSQITLNRTNNNVLIEAVSKVLNNASGEYSQTEQFIATGILMSVGTSDEQSRSLKKIARKKNFLDLLTN